MYKYGLMVLVLLLAFGIIGCQAVNWAEKWLDEQDLVITTIDQISEAHVGEVQTLPTNAIPEKYRESWKDDVIVLSKKDWLIPDGLYVPVSLQEEEWTDDTVATLAEAIFKGATTFFPWLAAFEGLLGVIFKRKRENYVAAIKAIVPYNGKVDFKSFLASLGKALGGLHTTSTANTEVKTA